MSRVLAFAAICFATTLAFADVQLWSGNPDNVTITDDDVRIDAAGTFKFQSVTSGNLDVIGSITVADGVTGEVIVYIERDTDNDSPGATNVGAINLTNNQGANLTGNLAELRITGDLATEGDVVCDAITGPITVGGTLDDDVSNGHKLAATSVTGAITLTGGLIGDIDVGALGDITIGNADDICDGNITIANEYTGAFNMTDSFRGNLVLHNNLAGSINITGTYYGHIEVDGDLVAPDGAIMLNGLGGPPITCDGWGRDFSGKRVVLTE